MMVAGGRGVFRGLRGLTGASGAFRRQPTGLSAVTALTGKRFSSGTSNGGVHKTIAELAEEYKTGFVKPPSESIWHIEQIQDFMEYLVNSHNYNWCAAIFATTFIFRMGVLHWNIDNTRTNAKVLKLRPQLSAAMDTVLSQNKSVTEMERLDAAVKIVNGYRAEKCNPYRGLLTPFVTAPLFLSIFMAAERLAIFNPALREGGFLWFTVPLMSLSISPCYPRSRGGLRAGPVWIVELYPTLTKTFAAEFQSSPPQWLP
jgi:membrane protein insertase Oxa1/YidC/SpoIIIJ